MTGEQILFLIVVWVLASVPLSLSMSGFIGLAPESERSSEAAAPSAVTNKAA